MTAEPAPLLGVEAAPVPPGGAAEWVRGEGGVRLRAALFPVASPRGSVILSGGRTEPIEKYYEVVEDLRSRGFVVLAHDWRGHGLSDRLTADPLRGHGGPARLYLGDFTRLLDAFETRLPRPWIGLGHSMGGGLTALALAEGERRLSAAVLSAPMMGVLTGGVPFALARLLAGAASRMGFSAGYVGGPGEPLGGGFEANVLTHDRARWTRTLELLTAHPELRLGNVTWAWLDFALALSARLAAVRPGEVAVPLVIVAAGEEKLVDNRASRRFADKVPGARWIELKGAFHEILMETDPVRAAFWAEFDRVAEAVAPSS